MTVGDSLSTGLSHISTHILQAELRRRDEHDRPACGSKGAPKHYNTAAHVFALFLILFLSTAACSFPIVVRRFPSIPVPNKFLFLSRHFGTGVLIATAFVHLLPTAFESLTDPCLPHFWNEGYAAMPGFIAMTSVFVVVGIEMFFASRGAGHVHSTDYETLGLDDQHAHARPAHKRDHSHGRFSNGLSRTNGHIPGIVLHDIESSDNLMAGRSPSLSLPSPGMPSMPTGRKARSSFDEDDDDDSDLDITPEELGPQNVHGPEDESQLLAHSHVHKHSHTQDDQPEDPAKTEAQNKKLLLQCLLLEAGILFHSVFIGMALSVATGTSFVVLLVAISFHQTFEGFALGSRISAIRFPAGSPRPWLMAMAYGTTTPIGQAIGLAIHTLYDPASQTGLLTVGFMNAISSGLLLFAGLVELLAEDFLSDQSYITLQGRRRLQACASVVGGALLMALVGAWA
ncbi:Zinc/iron permease [Plenodomus tracheiphilus IPT5]|uniref:Zinc/iron permease n=1 Tax=Plenodomus tracheiphilus IPT5 TaxID=1408161 RepID=A0A6A7AZN3_9PLEO|nr:Zinc/iron permease [Plenodomus tracheiphilus IPT5]